MCESCNTQVKIEPCTCEKGDNYYIRKALEERIEAEETILGGDRVLAARLRLVLARLERRAQ